MVVGVSATNVSEVVLWPRRSRKTWSKQGVRGGPQDPPGHTRRGGLAAAAAGVGGFLAAKTFGTPAAQATHIPPLAVAPTNFPSLPSGHPGGPVILGDVNDGDRRTTIFGSSTAATADLTALYVTHLATGNLSNAARPLTTRGILGETKAESEFSAGVRGVATTPSGRSEAKGVSGQSLGGGGIGVMGEANGGTSAVGVLGISKSGTGVEGRAAAGTSAEIGVLGSCSSFSGVGVVAVNSAGVAFRARGPVILEDRATIVGNLKVGPSNAVPALMVDTANPADGQTAILVRRNVGEVSRQRVSMGPPDSAGPGFRVLRAPN
jgi:hypothetical protein